jgi:hypothetical protein
MFGVTATTALAWAAAATAVVGAVSAIQSGKQTDAAMQSQANMDDYNAKKALQQADHANRMAGIKEDDQRRRMRASVGEQIASSSAAGAGLNADLIRSSLYDGEMDTAAIRYEGALQADGYDSSAAISTANASMARTQGSNAVSASYLNAASSLVGGATSYYKAKNPRAVY